MRRLLETGPNEEVPDDDGKPYFDPYFDPALDVVEDLIS
jgi:hypothetical protein